MVLSVILFPFYYYLDRVIIHYADCGYFGDFIAILFIMNYMFMPSVTE